MREVKKHHKRATQIHKRAELSGEVLIHDEDHLYIAPLKNLSTGGFFAARLTDLNVGKQVRLVVKSPSLQKSVQAHGIIVRIQSDKTQYPIIGSAIEFTSLSPKAREVIETCIFELKMEGLLKSA